MGIGNTEAYSQVLAAVQSAVGALELPAEHPLSRDVRAVAERAATPVVRVVVFGPFNYGKSTLLNALLGERALPIDLIPTTGAAIAVRYGADLATEIHLTDGAVMHEAGTEILQQFAILDGDRRMREDVASVAVTCPHPWLRTGVELVDLPGTDDQDAQDALVKEQLLTADLVVQVLDGRKLMTLGEREHLRDWLLDRGIETVVFVVNFLNLLEPEEQKQVYNRLRFVAESFRAKLPPGVSNLYRVDALPALRARLKGNMAAAQESGLPMLESALHTIVQSLQADPAARLPRLRAIAHRVHTSLEQKITTLRHEIDPIDDKQRQKNEIRQQAAPLLQVGFAKSTQAFADWLALTQLLTTYQAPAAQALQTGTFKSWLMGEFKRTAIDHQQAVVKWVHQACEFFEREKTHQFLVNFPPEPGLPAPQPTITPAPPKKSDLPPEAIAGGAVGFMLGGPVGAVIGGGASYLLNKTWDAAKGRSPAAQPQPAIDFYHYQEIAREYLAHFSEINLAALQRYKHKSDRLLHYEPKTLQTVDSHRQYQLQLLVGQAEQLQTILTSLD